MCNATISKNIIGTIDHFRYQFYNLYNREPTHLFLGTNQKEQLLKYLYNIPTIEPPPTTATIEKFEGMIVVILKATDACFVGIAKGASSGTATTEKNLLIRSEKWPI